MNSNFPKHPDPAKQDDFREWYESEERSPEALTNSGWVSEYEMEVELGSWP